MKNNHVKKFLLIPTIFILTACFTQSTSEESIYMVSDKKNITWRSPIKAPYNIFKSRNSKLSFPYKNGWICKEVVHDIRVDCYPEIRKGEEYDAGLNQPIVYYPNLSIHFENCDIRKLPPKVDSDGITYVDFLKKYGACFVKVLAEDGNILTEEQLDKIIYTKSESIILAEVEQTKRTVEKFKKEKQWTTYTNKKYGFTIDYPNSIKDYTVNVAIQPCFDSDSKSCGKFLIGGINESGEDFGMLLQLGVGIENEKDLEKFIQKKYGDPCKLRGINKSPQPHNLYTVNIAAKYSCDESNVGKILYSPKHEKAVAIDLINLNKLYDIMENIPGEYIDYTDQIIASFRFID